MEQIQENRLPRHMISFKRYIVLKILCGSQLFDPLACLTEMSLELSEFYKEYCFCQKLSQNIYVLKSILVGVI